MTRHLMLLLSLATAPGTPRGTAALRPPEVQLLAGHTTLPTPATVRCYTAFHQLHRQEAAMKPSCMAAQQDTPCSKAPVTVCCSPCMPI